MEKFFRFLELISFHLFVLEKNSSGKLPTISTTIYGCETVLLLAQKRTRVSHRPPVCNGSLNKLTILAVNLPRFVTGRGWKEAAEREKKGIVKKWIRPFIIFFSFICEYSNCIIFFCLIPNWIANRSVLYTLIMT